VDSIFVFVSGAALLIYSAERLIGYLVGIAGGLSISLFLLAVVFTGIEFDDIFLGVALNVEELDSVAMGIVFGTALSLTGVVLALAAILTPTKVSVPRRYLVIFAASPLVLGVLTLLAPFGTVDGIVLIGLFVVFLAYVGIGESRRDVPIFRDAELYESYAAVRSGPRRRAAVLDAPTKGADPPEDTGARFSKDMPFAEARTRSGWVGLALAVLAVIGLIIGAATTEIGIEGILETYGLEGTLFGATIATAVLTVEDIFLTVEPIRKGAPEIGVGNVIGSVVFSVTGKLGVILLAGNLVVGSNVLGWHLPALVVLTWLAAYFLATGQLRRWHGYVLLGLYIVYWVVSFGVFGETPAED
jgi:cation:H+ antiporter